MKTNEDETNKLIGKHSEAEPLGLRGETLSNERAHKLFMTKLGQQFAQRVSYFSV